MPLSLEMKSPRSIATEGSRFGIRRRKARDPIVLFRIDSEVRHVDLTISDVNQRSGGNEIIASDADGGLRIYSAAGKLLQVVSLGRTRLEGRGG